MAGSWQAVPGPAGSLAVHVAGAGGADVLGLAVGPGATGGRPRPGVAPPGRCLLVCHGLPVEPSAAARTGRTFPDLADRLAAESGWCVVACCLRGVGPSEGDFSLSGWAADLRAMVDRLAGLAADGVWMAGFGTSGSLALCVAADDDRLRGVVTLGAPARFDRWMADPAAAVATARWVGVVRTPGYPPDPVAWARAAGRFVPAEAVASLPPRPVLVVHGTDDEQVPVSDARTLAAAGGPTAELRILAGAGHRLRADPRAIALLLGWLERQGP